MFLQYGIHGMQQGMIDGCLDVIPSSSQPRLRRKDVCWFTLVWDYHPLFDRLDLNTTLQAVRASFDYELSHLFGSKVGFRLAWRNASGHLQFKLRSTYRCGKQQPPMGGW